MSENAKNSAADAAAEQKGRAENEEKTPKVDVEQIPEAETTSDATKSAEATTESTTKESKADSDKDAENVEKTSNNTNTDGTAVVTATTKSKSNDDKVEKIEIEIEASNKSHQHESFQTEVREQIENCKFELIAELQESIHAEMQQVADAQVRRVNRRRRAGFIIRDVIILLLAVLVGYFGYCLYDVKYFDFLKPNCEQTDCSNDNNNNEATVAEEPEIKDTNWYLHNYGYLFDSLKIDLDADKVTAYYLYSDDYKVSEIQPEYLLAMAYNRLDDKPTLSHDNNVSVSAEQMRRAFVNLYGSADYFVKQNFTYDCIEFRYNKENDSFLAPNISCPRTAKRQILEQVDEVYEEGNAIYFLTTATIYDKSEQSFYTFNNLFKPVVTNVSEADLSKHSALLNQYQYRFKKVDGDYYFSDVIKLR